MRVFPKRSDPEDWWRQGDATTGSGASTLRQDPNAIFRHSTRPLTDWLDPPEEGEDGHSPRHDVALAMMLMLGANPWQRIDGMGMARTALEAAETSVHAGEVTDDECIMLANARAWCHAVHADLSLTGQRDDPIVVADANRYVEMARAMDPHGPVVTTTLALLRIRQNRIDDAVQIAQDAVQAFGCITDGARTGRVHGSAVLAVMTLALAQARAGECSSARDLANAAFAVRTPLDIDDVALSSLMSEVSAIVGTRHPPSGASARVLLS